MVARRATVVPLAFGLWTVFVWGGRLRNLAAEPGGLADAGRWSLAGSVAFTALGLGLVVAAGLALVPRPARPLLWPVVVPLAALTTVVWIVRAVDIAIGDHSVAFVAVHVALAVVSIALAAAATALVAGAARSATLPPMGEPVTVVEKPAARSGYVRFETNRTFTGMGHETYRSGEPILRDRLPDDLARLLLATGQVDEVHVYGQTVTVKLADGATSDGLAELIEDLHIYYKPGVEVPDPESFAADG